MEARLRDFLPHQCALLLQKLDEVLETDTVRDPEVVHTRGRPAGTNESTTSTRRQPSNFELTEGGNKRKCGICKQEGHNRRRCPNGNEAISSGQDMSAI